MGDMQTQTMGPGGIFAQIRGGANAGGAYGGSRQGVLEAKAMDDFNRTSGNVSAQMRLAGRGQDINAAQGAMGQVPNLLSMLTSPASMLSGVGAQNRSQQQLKMDDALRRWGYNTFEPERRLGNLFSLLGAAPLGGWQAGSQTMSPAALQALQAGMPQGTSSTQNAIGGVAGGFGLLALLRQMGIL